MQYTLQINDDLGNPLVQIDNEFIENAGFLQKINKDGKVYIHPNQYIERIMDLIVISDGLCDKCDTCGAMVSVDHLDQKNDYLFICPNCKEND